MNANSCFACGRSWVVSSAQKSAIVINFVLGFPHSLNENPGYHLIQGPDPYFMFLQIDHKQLFLRSILHEPRIQMWKDGYINKINRHNTEFLTCSRRDIQGESREPHKFQSATILKIVRLPWLTLYFARNFCLTTTSNPKVKLWYVHQSLQIISGIREKKPLNASSTPISVRTPHHFSTAVLHHLHFHSADIPVTSLQVATTAHILNATHKVPVLNTNSWALRELNIWTSHKIQAVN